jgi:HAD superfamily hydrolase (TIGR01509 family)
MASFRGVVFDLDGTIVDNMSLHAEAFLEFTRSHDLPPLDEAMRARIDGKRNRDIFPILFGRDLPSDDLKRFSHEKESLYRKLSRGRLRPLRGLPRLLALLDSRGIPCAIATSAPAENVPHTLGEIGLVSHFPKVVRSDSVPRGKPHPDVFLAAASLLAIPPTECLAFEDAPIGVVAAHAAGMSCVAIATSFPAAAFAEHGAAPDAVVSDFDAYLAGPGRWLLADEDRRKD